MHGRSFVIVSRVPETLFISFFASPFSLCYPGWVIFIFQSSNSQTLSSVLYVLLLSSSFEFLASFMVLFHSKPSVCFFRSSVYLLRFSVLLFASRMFIITY